MIVNLIDTKYRLKCIPIDFTSHSRVITSLELNWMIFFLPGRSGSLVMHGFVDRQWISHHCRTHCHTATTTLDSGAVLWWIPCTRVYVAWCWEYLLPAGATSAAASQSSRVRQFPSASHTSDILLSPHPLQKKLTKTAKYGQIGWH